MKKSFFILVLLTTLFSFTVNGQTDMYSEWQRQFDADTARVESAVRAMLDQDYSTVGMIEATLQLEKGYDELLNKYYKILSGTLDAEGKKALTNSQRLWIQLRDADKTLVGKLYSAAYQSAGGGTIWGVVAADARADITRRRVFELYNYLMFGNLG